jgi:hypothetical protein
VARRGTGRGGRAAVHRRVRLLPQPLCSPAFSPLTAPSPPTTHPPACFLIVVDRLEGPALAQGIALRLVRAALRRGHYGLSAEILRFMMPPGFKVPGSSPGGSGAFAAPPPPERAAGGGWLSWLWSFGGGGGDAAAPPRRPRASSGGGGGPRSSSSGGGPAAEEACHAVSDHGWLLLESGRHAALAQLLGAMAFLPAGLPGLMAAYRASYLGLGPPDGGGGGAPDGGAPGGAGAWWARGEGAPGEEEVAAALVDAVGELPVWEGPGVEEVRRGQGGAAGVAGRAPAGGTLTRCRRHVSAHPATPPTAPPPQDAAAVLRLCSSLGATKWTLALALLLVDTDTLGPFAAAHPELWGRLCGRLEAEPRLAFMGEWVGALSALGGGGGSSGGSGSGGSSGGGSGGGGSGGSGGGSGGSGSESGGGGKG